MSQQITPATDSQECHFLALESQVKILLRTVAILNQSIEDECEYGGYTDYQSDSDDYSDSGESRRSSDASSYSKESDSNNETLEYLSVEPIVQYFIRESGLSTSVWKSRLEPKP
jgi:hypothetical protein